jgi:hypothetical protein
VASTAERQAAYRASPDGQEYVRRNRAIMRARGAALTTLARNHPAEYDLLYTAELKRDGLWPLQQAGRKAVAHA